MNRDEGQYFLPHILMGQILIKKHQIDKSNGNTKNIAKRQSTVSSQWCLRQQLIAETYTVSAYFGSELKTFVYHVILPILMNLFTAFRAIFHLLIIFVV